MPSDFINGRFVDPATPDGVLEVRSPADQSDVVGRHPWALATSTPHDARRAVTRRAAARSQRSVQSREFAS